ncbi:MAG: hypothetical protein M3227_05505 [Thermoproteota archaeon]|nr:hypothetical protein [Thermoproteota archaeon]
MQQKEKIKEKLKERYGMTTDKVSTFNEINRILDQMVDAAKYQLAGR